MGKALYRKYRSKSLSEIVGQKHITDTLSRALKQGMVSHAYLLTGPRGVGKTSIARILAYEVNGLPYDEEATHLDIIEIDAASNRRIDEIRELKERVHIAPTSAKYKVYIIDEVHMLTKEAFNALLKTLEEPPEHVIFILATTEAHKVPETIISRTQRFTFKPVATDKVVNHLKTIASAENISIDDDALGLIAAHGEGSFRDSISLLDQVRHTNQQISLKDVQQAVGQAPDDLLNSLLESVGTHNIKAIAQSLAALTAHGVQAAQISGQLSKILRAGILQQTSRVSPQKALKLLAELIQIPASNDPSLALELALYNSAFGSDELRVMSHETAPETSNFRVQNSEKQQTTKIQKDVPESSGPVATQNSKLKTHNSSEAKWQEILNAIKGNHNTLYGIARMASPKIEGSNIILSFAFPFHMKRLNDSKNKQLLMDIASRVMGQDISIECVAKNPIKKELVNKNVETKNRPNINLETISNIFGGVEIVE